jgi:hypothetical protein
MPDDPTWPTPAETAFAANLWETLQNDQSGSKVRVCRVIFVVGEAQFRRVALTRQ